MFEWPSRKEATINIAQLLAAIVFVSAIGLLLTPNPIAMISAVPIAIVALVAIIWLAFKRDSL